MRMGPVPKVQITRRGFLRTAGVAVGIRPAIGPTRSRRSPILVVIVLRGGLDGLNVLVPFGDPGYATLRPLSAIRPPDTGAGSAIDLDGFFGLHPGLSALIPLYMSGRLAVVHACGLPGATRSHLVAQEAIARGTVTPSCGSTGWVGRLLKRQLDGSVDRVAIAGGEAALPFVEGVPALLLDDVVGAPGRADEFDPLTSHQDGHLTAELQRLATAIEVRTDLVAAVIDSPGWDDHDPASTGPSFAARLTDLGDGLARFARRLGDRFTDTLVLTVTEFGRSAAENRRGGTDHGQGSVMMLLGGAVDGGIYGTWPGLALDELIDQRDVAITTDVRSVIGGVATRHLGFAEPAGLFPGLTPAAPPPRMRPGHRGS
jgi:uncharacterized protein (DUF1501 family)